MIEANRGSRFLLLACLASCGNPSDGSEVQQRPLTLEIFGAGEYRCSGLIEMYSGDPNQTAASAVLQIGLDCERAGDAFGIDLAFPLAQALQVLSGDFEPDSPMYFIRYREADGREMERPIAAAAAIDDQGRFQLQMRFVEEGDAETIVTEGRWPTIACRVATDASGASVEYDTDFDSSFCREALNALDIGRFESIAP